MLVLCSPGIRPPADLRLGDVNSHDTFVQSNTSVSHTGHQDLSYPRGSASLLTLGATKAFEADYGTKWLKAAAKITNDLDVLGAFYGYPAEHWIHPRTTNPIGSTLVTVWLRTRESAMAVKLIESAPARWRAVSEATSSPWSASTRLRGGNWVEPVKGTPALSIADGLYRMSDYSSSQEPLVSPLAM
jgi:hypothetical protein